MIYQLAFKILILLYVTDFFLIYNMPKISKPWNLAYLKVLQAQKQCSKFQNFVLSTKNKITETQKCTQAAWASLVLSIFNLLCQLWGVITFEQVISLCRNFQDNLLYIPFIWKSFIKIWDGSCLASVHLIWNDPIVHCSWLVY